jgi:hypothetical protein
MATVASIVPDIRGTGVGQPAEAVWNITPSDTVDLLYVTRAIRVGTAGDLAIKSLRGDVTIIPDMLAGETIACRAVLVYATNTTATGIVGYA